MQNELYHYGILGMRWGRRKSSNVVKAAPKQSQEKTATPKKQSIKDMSDDDLKKAVVRLQMEKTYSQLSSEKIGKGKSFVEKTMKAGSTLATASSTAITLYNNYSKIMEIMGKKPKVPTK